MNPPQSTYFVDGPGGTALRGQRCLSCGHVAFPRRPICPHCHGSTNLAEAAIGRCGVVKASAVTYVGQPGFPLPQVQAFVAMDEGPVIFSLLTGVPEEMPVPPGTAVALVKVGPATGYPMAGWMYRPIPDPAEVR